MSGRPSWKSGKIGLFRPFSAFFALFRRVRRAPGKSRKRRKKAFFLRYPQICLNPHLLNPHLRHPKCLCMMAFLLLRSREFWFLCSWQLVLRSGPPFTGVLRGPGRKVPPGVFFQCFWAPGSECPKECFLSAFWRF